MSCPILRIKDAPLPNKFLSEEERFANVLNEALKFALGMKNSSDFSCCKTFGKVLSFCLILGLMETVNLITVYILITVVEGRLNVSCPVLYLSFVGNNFCDSKTV